MENYNTYLSPYTWRYGTPEMRLIWSEANKRHIWRKVWVALAEVQAEFGLVKPEEVADLRLNSDNIDVPRSLEIEAEIQHDLMAELKVFAQQAPRGGRILHLGATSMDIEDNTEVLRMRQSLEILRPKLVNLLVLITEKIDVWADLPLMGFTHLQPAEPTTLGYRFAQYAQDLVIDWQMLQQIQAELRGKGFKGAVGTGASYAELLGVDNLDRFEERLAERLELQFFPVTTQVYPRKQDYQVISALAGLGSSLYKFAFDLRILQSPPFGELGEPFGEKQVGSSAMPFKRNPIKAEKIDSLARALAQMPRLAWDNAANSLLERTLDDSANRRSLLPESFLICDELLETATCIIKGLQVDEAALASNLAIYGPFAATERVLMALVKAGADRQETHELLRQHTLSAWEMIKAGQPNPLARLVTQEAEFHPYLSSQALSTLMEAGQYLGNAPLWARRLAGDIRSIINSTNNMK
jgi:adenylosuccinate lyase